MFKIREVRARQVLDSRGNPTVEVDVRAGDKFALAIVPSGASTGIHEALELRDGGKRFFGRGVSKAVNNVNKIIAKKLVGFDVRKQEEIDNLMLKLDGTENKSKLGANAILGVSLACAKVAAEAEEINIYEYIGKLSKNKKFTMPVPMVLVLEGGKHADQSSDFQEFMIMPYKAKSFRERIRIGSEIYHAIGKLLKSKGRNINVGFEGAYSLSQTSNETAFEIIIEGIEKAGYKPKKEILIAIDAAASEFFKNRKYNLKTENRSLSANEMIDFYEGLIKKYPIASIEDGLAEDDWTGWQRLNKNLGKEVQIVGDDLLVTDIKRMRKAIKLDACNSLLLKVNQIGTLTEALNAAKLAMKHDWKVIVSHRSGETEDPFIADLAVGIGCGMIKAGAPCRGERTAKYNQLLRIEENLGRNAVYRNV